ncbi:MAG: hypothetical protein AAFZ15_22905 [Bacteroidota bacterium]
MSNSAFYGSFLFLLFFVALSACKDDDDANPQPLVYDASRHIYGTTSIQGQGSWETIIDLESGRFDTIPGTRENAGGFNFPLSTRELTDFVDNRRLFITFDKNDLVVQDLETAEKNIINLVGNPNSIGLAPFEYLNFGKSNNEVLGLYTFERTIYRVDIMMGNYEPLTEYISMDQDQITNMLYSPENDYMIFFGQNNDTETVYLYSIFDMSVNEIIAHDTIPRFFGFVKHPSQNSIYCLTIPMNGIGFRLTELMVKEDRLDVRTVSTTDLEIDQLSPNLQTIHSATNSYICKGGSTSIENPETFLYSIDLTTGQLLRSTEVPGYGSMMNIESE